MTRNNFEKNVDRSDFTIQTEGLSRSLEIVVESDESNQKLNYPSSRDKFWCKIKKGEFESVRYEDIIMIKSQGHYNSIFIKNRLYPIIIKATLEKELYNIYFKSFDNFFLLSKSVILNLDYVIRIEGSLTTSYLDGKETLKTKIPRGKKVTLLKHLGIND